ncbi:MAG: YdeI/OmpD-associated family protein [Planktomarina sp.]
MSFDQVEFRSRTDARAWLEANHNTAGTVWAVTYKKHTPYYLAYGDLISELLCWGWVDSVSGRVDEDRSRLRISPRSPKSAWSSVNKTKVEEARDAGLMMPAGEAMITIAKANGMWQFLDDVERLAVPDDLEAALGLKRPVWDAYPRSVKRGTLEWIKTAKRAETRAKRISEVAEAVAEELRPKIFR